jgi:hypothetical protein
LRIRRLHVSERLVANQVAQRPPDHVEPRHVHARREGLVRLHDSQVRIDDRDKIDQRVEGVFEQPPLPEHIFEQQDVLNPDRELAGEFVREGEPRRIGGVPLISLFDDEGAQRATPAAERRHDPCAALFRPLEPQPRSGVVRGVVDLDFVSDGSPAGRRRQDQFAVPPLVQPDFHGASLEDVADLGRKGLQADGELLAVGDPLRKNQQHVAEALVDAHLPLEPCPILRRV